MSDEVLTIVIIATAILGFAALAAAVFTWAHGLAVGRMVDHVARHDQLTGLPNRDAGIAAVDRQRLSGRPFGLVIADLDRFSAVNDTYGQELGDRLFLAFVNRIAMGLRPDEVLVRWGGPQLLIVSPGMADRAAATRRAAELTSLVDARVQLGHDTLRVSSTVGAVAIGPSVTTTDDAVEAAQEALRSARASRLAPTTTGGSRQGEGHHTARHALRGDSGGARERVRQALEGDEFWLLFAPIANLETRAIAGVESILHWSDPRRGVLHIDEVRDELARSGLEAEVAWTVLGQAVERLAAWSTAHPELELVVNVAVPTSLLASEDPAGRIQDLLAATGAPASQLCIGVCGRDRHDLDRTGSILRAVQGTGVLLGLDDFGTSWSSLSYLRRSAPSVLKVPARFVAGLGTDRADEAIVQQIVGLARSLDVEPIAEGAARPQQVDVLRSVGCGLALGPIVGPPQPPESMEVQLARGLVDLAPR